MDLKGGMMKHRVAMMSGAVVLVMIGVSGCFSQQKNNAPAAQRSSGGSAHPVSSAWSGSHSAEISDPAYGMAAFTIDVPNGWKFAGTILRPAGCHASAYPAAGLSYSVLSPDGVSAYMVLPGVSWTGSSNGYNFQGQKCPSNINIDSAAGLLLNIAVPSLHPDAKSVTVLPLDPKFQAALAANSEQATADLRRNGLQGRAIQDAARVRVEYELNGQPIEELEFTVVDCQQTQAQATMGRPYTRLICYSRGTSIIRAPKGHLDEMIAHKPAFQQINSAWNQRVIQDMTSRFQQMQEASNRQFQQMTEHYAKVNQDLIARSRQEDNVRADGTRKAIMIDRDAQAATDHSAQRTAQFSLDRQTFINPSTGEKIEASNQYNHQWMSSDGSTLIQTQDHTLDPNGVVYPVSQSWTELIPSN
jgi:hypothetical protein